MAEKHRFTTEMIARNILRKFFVSLIWSVILIRYTTVGKSIMVIITSGYGNHE